MKLQFDAQQDFQLQAIQNVVELFTGFGDYNSTWGMTTDEIHPNIPTDEDLDEEWLLENLQYIQEDFDRSMESRGTPTMKIGVSQSLEMDRGQMVENVSNDAYEFPSFSIEMETGTGKTYVYLRTILELNKQYGFQKFVIVVPSVAIYQGVKKSFEITRNHFKTLYGNDLVALRAYDSTRIQEVKTFATGKNVEILLMTLAAFNRFNNNIYKPTDKLPGELRPYQYIQRSRPILILDEPQNMGSTKAKDAIRTLMPLFALHYSATHKETPNLVYRLTPVEAFRRNLVKRIQVVGIEKVDTGGKAFLSLKAVKGTGKSAKATLIANTNKYSIQRIEEVILKTGDHLFEKTQFEDHKGYVVENIGSGKGQEFVEFENNIVLNLEGGDGVSRPDIFRYQIRETIEQHIAHQKKIESRGIKVLSLFFIDRVANFLGDGEQEGIIRKIFNEEFRRVRDRWKSFEDKSPEEVQASYFASYRKKSKGSKVEQIIYVDQEATNASQKKAEKEQFELIMKNKEQLLSFEEPVCFIFAHSALKEGWDNPNIFQICTLNQTLSITKKRQEIGRGLRLAVDQNGHRVHDDQVNILTVVANESYDSFATTLQREYKEQEGEAPPKPRPKRASAKRQDKHYQSKAFRDFWKKLTLKSEYDIVVDTPALIKEVAKRLQETKFPSPKMVISKGNFVMTNYTFRIKSFEEDAAIISLVKEDTKGNKINFGGTIIQEGLRIQEGTNLEKELKEKYLRGFVVNSIDKEKTNPEIVFKNGEKVSRFKPLTYQVSDNKDVISKESQSSIQQYKVFNIIDKLAHATSLTKETCYKIFKRIPRDEQLKVFQNPDGFSNKLIEVTKNALADHVAQNIVFYPSKEILERDMEELFPIEMQYVQTEIIETPRHGLYDKTQKDSEVEEVFVLSRLEQEEEVVMFFKFPSKYRIDFPKVIGNYNPDWAIIRKNAGGFEVELVRETKGSDQLEKLRFAHERRKVIVAQKHFESLNIDYDMVSEKTRMWYRKRTPEEVQQGFLFDVKGEE